MVKRNGNNVYFYSDTDKDSILQLRLFFEEILDEKQCEVKLHINSDGGEVDSALSFYDYLKTYKLPVWGTVEGHCYSSAFFILLGCDIREMDPHSVIMSHQMSLSMENFTPLDVIKNCVKGSYYLEHFEKKILRKELKKKDISMFLDKDLYITPKKAKKLGITGFMPSFERKCNKKD